MDCANPSGGKLATERPLAAPAPAPRATHEGVGSRKAAHQPARLAAAWAAAASVSDPEIPSLTLEDLGILRSVTLEDDTVAITIVPTYTGCPATDAIRDDLHRALAHADIGAFAVRIALSPAWQSDWISETGRRKLREAGIAPPACGSALGPSGAQPVRFVARAADAIACPRCGSHRTEMISEYGSTACKSLYRCQTCAEPFDYFKPY